MLIKKFGVPNSRRSDKPLLKFSDCLLVHPTSASLHDYKEHNRTALLMRESEIVFGDLISSKALLAEGLGGLADINRHKTSSTREREHVAAPSVG